MKAIKNTIHAFRITFRSRNYAVLSIILTIAMVIFTFFFPFIITPTTTIKYQLSLLTWWNALLLVIFSILFGISMAMHIYGLRLQRKMRGAMMGESFGTGIVGMIGSMFSGPLCISCISILFSTIGLGSSAALAVFAYKDWIFAISFLLVLTSIYFAGKRIHGCKYCKK